MRTLLPILLVLTGCAMRAQQSFPGINITPNPAGTAGKIQMRTGANVNDVYMQQGSSSQGMVVVSLLGTVSMSTESVLPIGDNTSDLGSTGASAKRWANVNSVQFFAPNGTSVSEGCWMLSFAMGCGPSVFAPTFSADRVTGQVKSAVLAGSGTVCLQTDNSGNIGKAAAGCGTMVNPMTATGDIIYALGGSTPTRLPAGVSGTCLITAGTPGWQACDTGNPWAAYTPSVVCASGAVVTTTGLNAAYDKVAKFVKIRIAWEGSVSVACTGLGFSTPTAPLFGALYQSLSTYHFVGANNISAAAVVLGGGTNLIAVGPTGVAASFPGATSFTVIMEGIYEAN